MSVEMTMERRVFEGGLADLGFAMDVPEGFVMPEFPRENVDFDNPTLSAPLALLSSPVAMALIAVAARPAYATGSVLQWLRYLAGHYEIDLQHVQIRSVGKDGAHPAVTAFATQVQDGQKLNFMMVAFEDGGRLVTAHGMCPAELWASYGTALSNAVESITLLRPKGPQHDVDSMTAEGWVKITPSASSSASSKAREESERYAAAQKELRAPAVARAEVLLAEDRYDEAERAIMEVDSSIYGGGEIAHMYERRLKGLVAAGVGRDRDRVEAVFRRALSWAQGCYPEPHTEIEADDYETGRAEDRTRLVAVLGYDPDAGGAGGGR